MPPSPGRQHRAICGGWNFGDPQGTDLRTIQLLMGHAHLEHTTVYLHLSRRHLHAALNPLDQIKISRYGEARQGKDEPS